MAHAQNKNKYVTAMHYDSAAVWDETAVIAPYRVPCWSPRTKDARANPSELVASKKKGAPRTSGDVSQQRERKNCSVFLQNPRGKLESGSSEKREGC